MEGVDSIRHGPFQMDGIWLVGTPRNEPANQLARQLTLRDNSGASCTDRSFSSPPTIVCGSGGQHHHSILVRDHVIGFDLNKHRSDDKYLLLRIILTGKHHATEPTQNNRRGCSLSRFVMVIIFESPITNDNNDTLFGRYSPVPIVSVRFNTLN